MQLRLHLHLQAGRHVALTGARCDRFARFAGLCPPAATGNGRERRGMLVRHQVTDSWADKSILLPRTWKHLVYLAVLPGWPGWSQRPLRPDVQPCLAGPNGQTAFADGPNIRLGRQDEIQIASVMSQRCDIPSGTRFHKAVQRLAAASMCYCQRDLDMNWPLEGAAAVDARLPLPFSYFFIFVDQQQPISP